MGFYIGCAIAAGRVNKKVHQEIIESSTISVLNDIYLNSGTILANLEKAKKKELAKVAATPTPTPPPPAAVVPAATPAPEIAAAPPASAPVVPSTAPASSSEVASVPPPASPPVYPPASAPALAARSCHAIVIGIDAYSADASIPPLQNAVADSKAIAEALRSHYGFQVRELYDAQATRSGIHLAIRETLKQLGEGENLLIYYAGHGWEDTMVKEGYWVPVDGRMNDPSTFVNNAELHKLIRAMEKAQHVFIVADSCFSGSFLSRAVDGRSIGVRTEGAAPDSTEVLRFFQKMDNRKSRLVLTSGGNEPVPDGGRDGHSVFGYYFLRALTNPDELVFTAAELMQRVQKAVANNSYQTPLVGDLKGAGHEEGQMVFIRKTGNH